MSTRPRMAATRMNLVRARRDLARVEKGAQLIRRKREALVAELFRVARPAMDFRARIARAAQLAAESMVDALGARGAAELQRVAWPIDERFVELSPAMVWGIPVSDIVSRPPMTRSVEARGGAPGTLGPATVAATSRYEILADLLIDAAPREQRIRRLGEAVSHASRQLRTLEQFLEPQISRSIADVSRQLDEREREERLRLKVVQRRRAAAGPNGD